MGFLSFMGRAAAPSAAPSAAPVSSPRVVATGSPPHAESNASATTFATSAKRVSFQEVGALPAGDGLPPAPVHQIEAAPSTSPHAKVDPYTGMAVKSEADSIDDSFKAVKKILSTPVAKAPAPTATMPGGRPDPYAAFRNNYKRAG